MEGKSKDMGDMTSREIGNLVSKGLVNIGKEVLAEGSSAEADYGDLPSRALSELGKKAIES
jgi:hypothetical protein